MTTNKELDAEIAGKLIHAVYDSYKSRETEGCIQDAMKVPGATPEIMRQVADNIERQSTQNQGVEWGDVRARNMDACWASALREAAKRTEELVQLANKLVAEVMDEEKLCEDFKKAQAEYERLASAVRDLYLPRAKRALEARDEKLLRAYLDECPDHIANVLILGMLRQLTKGE